MPPTRQGGLGIAALGAILTGLSIPMAMVACGPLPETSATPAPAPSATAVASASAAPNWVQDLTFGGDVAGNMARIAPPAPNQMSECSGKNSKSGGAWASSVFGPVGGDVLGVVILASGYRGPGTYDQAHASVQVHSLDNSRVWSSLAGDRVSFTVGADEESGTLDATLTNLSTGKSKLSLSGRWSCRT